MPDDTNPNGGATPPTDTGVTPTPAAGATPVAMTLEQYQAALADRESALKTARDESIAHRKKLKAFEDAQAAADLAKLDETQKAAKRADDAEAKLKEYQDKLMSSQVKLAAQSLGFNDPGDASRLIDLAPDATDEDIQQALEALAKKSPYLIKADATPPAPVRQAPGNPPRGATVQPAPAFDYKNPPTLNSIWNKPKS